MRQIIIKRTGILAILLVFTALSSFGQVTGTVNYHENPTNPLPDVTIDLYDINDNFIATTTTDNNGEFDFTNIPAGDYYISASADLTLGDVNLIDASLILQYLLGLVTFTDYEFVAADVNGSGNITFGDYMLVLVFHIMQGNPFPGENWHFDDVPVTVSAAKNTAEPAMVWGTSSGDVEGIWQPGGRDLDILDIESMAQTEITSQEVVLEIGSDYESTINGFNLNLVYPNNLIEVTGVIGPDDNFHFDLNQETGVLKVAWLDESSNPGQTFSAETLFSVAVKKLDNHISDNAVFSLLDGGMILNSRNDEVEDVTIKLPTIKTTSNIQEIEAVSYPNPVMNTLNLKVTSPDENTASIKVYDLQGRMIHSIDNLSVYRGTQLLTVNTETLPQGQYVYTISIGDENLHGRFLK